MTGARIPAAIRPDELENTILTLVKARGIGKTICPSEVARALAGSDEKAWRQLMKPIRATVVRLAADGRLCIFRKGRVVDPADFKGVYRLGSMSPDDEGAGAGNSESVRPVEK